MELIHHDDIEVGRLEVGQVCSIEALDGREHVLKR